MYCRAQMIFKGILWLYESQKQVGRDDEQLDASRLSRQSLPLFDLSLEWLSISVMHFLLT